MVGIEELVGGDPLPHQTTYNACEAGSVHGVTDGQVTVVVSTFDLGKQVYATVPFIKKTDGDPASGDPAVLHSDSGGNPIYAVVLS